MLKVLIVDDEPIVLVGLQSMIQWEQQGFLVCGTARNGSRALELIDELDPDIVISDIRMPLCSGLDLARKVRQNRRDDLPVFIFLTSYEEFEYARTALQLGAVEYLVKLDLCPENLTASLVRARERVALCRHVARSDSEDLRFLHIYREKFFARLYHGLFETREQFAGQLRELGLRFEEPAFCMLCCSISPAAHTTSHTDALKLISETANKFCRSIITGLEKGHFAILLCLDAPPDKKLLSEFVASIQEITRQLMNLSLFVGIGEPFEDLFCADRCFQQALKALACAQEERPVVFFSACDAPGEITSLTALTDHKIPLTHALEESDPSAVREVFHSLLQQMLDTSVNFATAMSIADTVLSLTISLLPNSEPLLHSIFSREEGSYRCLYRKTTAEGCLQWLQTLEQGLYTEFSQNRRSYKERTLQAVQRYIQSNIGQKLTLPSVAAFFNFSPSYLSQLFSKYSDRSFVEYITAARVEKAKELLCSGDQKIYEVSDALGFESAFYFSTVFKKYTGYSPRDYIKTFR